MQEVLAFAQVLGQNHAKFCLPPTEVDRGPSSHDSAR